jgi:transposase, IS5 family
MISLFHTKIEPKKNLRKAELLEETKTLIPFEEMAKIIDEKFEKKQTWRPRRDTIVLLKLIFLQRVFGLADEAVEEDIYDRATFRAFLWNEYVQKYGVPDATSLCRFRRFLEEHNLHKDIFADVVKKFEDKGLIIKTWTIVDATIIKAPSSTKNESKSRDPEMKSTKKWANYQFGMKAHAGCDMDSGIVHSVEFTSANIHDSQKMEDVFHGEEKAICGDKWYVSQERKKESREKGIIYWILEKAGRGKKLSSAQKKHNKKWQSIRAKSELPFWILKKRRKNDKVRYKWLFKNEVWWTFWFTFGNFYLAKRYERKIA